MSKFIILILFFSSLLATIGFAGGVTSNGGGGQKQKVDMTPNGFWGEILNSSQELSYQVRVGKFEKRYPGAKIVRCGKKGAYPDFTDYADQRFEFRVEEDRGVLTSVLSSSDPKFKILNKKNVCSSNQLIEAVGTFSITLYQLEKNDEVGKSLIEEIVKENKINVDFYLENKIIAAKNGEQSEFTWFNHETGTIGWSPPNLRQGMAALVGRTHLSFLRHELTHVLLKQKIIAYPKPKFWHDASHGHDHRKRMKNWGKIKTSSAVAYIEGIAFAMEAGTYMEHPYNIRLQQNTLWFLMNEKETQRWCYRAYGPNMIVRNRELFAPTDNEIYVTSTLTHLFMDYEIPKRMKKGMLTKEHYELGNVAYRVQNQRMINLIKGISKWGPFNLNDLAFALDDVSGNDLGERWYREFYYRDLENKTALDVDLELIYFDNDEGKPYPLICAKEGRENKFFTPQLVSSKNSNLKKSKIIHARNVSVDKIEKRVLEIREKLRDFNETALKGQTGIELIEAIGRKISKSSLCSLNQGELRTKIKYLYQKILEKNYDASPTIMFLKTLIVDFCTRSPKEALNRQINLKLEYLVLLNKELKKLENFKNEADFEEHLNHVQSVLKIGRYEGYSNRNLVTLKALFDVLKDPLSKY